MSITVKQKVAKYLNSKLSELENGVVKAMLYQGEDCVNDARTNGSYTDQTGNLRSSIGCIVTNDGQSVSENFKASGNGTDKTTGLKEGTEFARKIASKDSNGIHLVLVAGMPYAEYVENHRNVLKSAELLAKGNINGRIKDVVNKWTKGL